MLPPIAILAGGMATRLYPETEHIAKSMIDICGEPFVAHQLRLLKAHGASRVVMCVGNFGEQIEVFVGDGARFGLDVHYSYDGDPLRGTGGALKAALPLLDEYFITMYGDSYLDVPLAPIEEHFLRSKKSALMTVFRNENRWDKSNVEFSGGEIRAYDKRMRDARMHHIDYGIGMFKRAVFLEKEIPEKFDLEMLYQRLLTRGELAGYEVTQRFYEIGSRAGIEEFSQLIKSGK